MNKLALIFLILTSTGCVSLQKYKSLVNVTYSMAMENQRIKIESIMLRMKARTCDDTDWQKKWNKTFEENPDKAAQDLIDRIKGD